VEKPVERRRFLGKVEELSRAELDELQLRRLRKQLARVKDVPFFAHRLGKDFEPDRITSLRQFADVVPTVEKADLLADQEAEPPFGTRLTVPADDVARFEITSGTSGLGQETYGLTWADMETIGTMGAWTFAMAGVVPGDRVAVTLPLGYLQGPWGGDWASRSLGCAVYHLGLAPDSATKLRYMQRFAINGLYTPTPTYLMRLTRIAEGMGLEPRRDLPEFKTAWLAGEAYPVVWAERMEEFWGVRLCETYGSTQGAFAATCEYGVVSDGERGVMHNADWNVLLEVVDPITGEPVAEGETGEALITTLVRQASPVLRFRTKDRVRLVPHDGCPCGRRTIALEAGTIGRLDDMIKVKGMNVWPAAVESIVLGDQRVEEYVAEVGIDDRGHEYVHLKVAFRAGVPADDRTTALPELAKKVRAITNVSMDTTEIDAQDLPTFEYKAKRWYDRRADQLSATLVGGGR
jgi:phenylacetate-CoA ligase